MFVRKKPGNGTPLYYLAAFGDDGLEKYTMAYGNTEPSFYRPDLRLGLCETQLESVEPNSVDLIVDDPPYGITKQQWDDEPDWDELTELYGRVLSDTGLVVIFGRHPSLMPVYEAFTNDGFEFRFEIVWRKHNSPWVSNHMPIPIHENIFVFSKKGTKACDLTFNLEDVKQRGTFHCPSCEETHSPGPYKTTVTNDRKPSSQGGWQDEWEQEAGEERFPTTVLDQASLQPFSAMVEFDAMHGKNPEYRGFSGQKPTPLLTWLLLALSNRGDTVLDPHAGSASTLKAAIPLCRQAIGVEIDRERYKQSTAQLEAIIDDLSGLKHATISDTTCSPVDVPNP